MEPNDALELCSEILGLLDDLPDRAEDFAASVEEKVQSMQEWIEEHGDCTANMGTALENMHAGVLRWLD
jgi:hypothetical protein